VLKTLQSALTWESLLHHVQVLEAAVEDLLEAGHVCCDENQGLVHGNGLLFRLGLSLGVGVCFTFREGLSGFVKDVPSGCKLFIVSFAQRVCLLKIAQPQDVTGGLGLKPCGLCLGGCHFLSKSQGLDLPGLNLDHSSFANSITTTSTC
jgi:hypothetical protein